MELIFEVRDAEEGGYWARALEHAIFTEANTWGRTPYQRSRGNIAALRRRPDSSPAATAALREGLIVGGNPLRHLIRYREVRGRVFFKALSERIGVSF